MEFSTTNTFDAEPAAVFEAMTDPDVLVEKYESLGHRDVDVLEWEEEEGRVRVRSRRVVPLDVPSFARKVISPTNVVEQVDEWSAADKRDVRTGTWTATAKGVPVSLGGTLRLAPRKGGGTTLEIGGEAGCKLPLVGGKIASFIGSSAVRTIDGEYRFNRRHLGEPEP